MASSVGHKCPFHIDKIVLKDTPLAAGQFLLFALNFDESSYCSSSFQPTDCMRACMICCCLHITKETESKALPFVIEWF